LVEIDAASNRGIDEIRELKERVRFAPSNSPFKVFIIDEVHMLTAEAFNALLKTLEEPPAHVVFILATTEPHKVPATVLSRCQRFDFVLFSIFDIVKELKKIARLEKIKFDDDALRMIAASASGSMRDAITILDQIASSGKKIRQTEVQKILGIVSERAIIKLLDTIIEGNLAESIELISRIEEQGYNLTHFRENLLEFMRRTLLFKAVNDPKMLKESYSKESLEKIKKQAESISLKRLCHIIRLISRYADIGRGKIPSLGLEVALVELSEENEAIGQNDNVLSEKETKPAVARANKPLDKNTWQEIIEGVKPHNHSLSAILKSATLLGLSGKNIVIEVDFPFHRDKIEHVINKEAIEEVVTKVIGPGYAIVCRIVKKEAKDLKDVALEVFGS
jgi:DNA polymerase-3 subunit gamma/tau